MSALVRTPWSWLVALGAVLALSGCNDDAFCFSCEPGNGQNGGGAGNSGSGTGSVLNGGGGAGPGTGGGFNFGGATCGVPNNVANCGECGKRCERLGALATCDVGPGTAACAYECSVGFIDRNGDMGNPDPDSNGCEYECLETNDGAEICDALDNDCDGNVDEGIDTNNDVNNCGACGTPCSLPHASTVCSAGLCAVDQCLPGWHDLDNDPTKPEAAGCEYFCESTGPEVCDGIDNDCDKLIDDEDPDVAVDTDVRHCGSCSHNCEGEVPNASPACVAAQCVVGNCLTGFFDQDPGVPGCEGSCSNQNCSFPFAFANCDDQGTCTQGDCLPNYYDFDPTTPGCEYYCVPTGAEICDGKDNDCDGLVDQADPDVQTDTDPLNCGACGTSCAGAFDNSLAVCLGGDCVLRCINGFVDTDGDGQSCEFNCDACFFPNASADDVACLATGTCVFGGCLPGYVDTDPAIPGCEYQCTPTVPSTEVCDGRDNDCNGEVDEGVTLTPQNCGGCGLDCALFFPGANTSCTLVGGRATCGFVSCLPGYGNVDGVTQNGCEYLCTRTSPSTEACDGRDNDCNGVIDDVAAGSLPNACTGANDLGVGECDATTRCVQVSTGVFAPRCVQTKGPATEICDSDDNDCDGQTDENPPTDPLPGVGIPCGTSQGSCSFGTRACQGGVLACTGGQLPVAEACNGADDNCNGLVDDLPASTCGITTGACDMGTSQCVNGSSVCTGSIQAATEVCDANGSTNVQFDNNCNGSVDEGCIRASGTPIRHDRGGLNGSTTSNTSQHQTFQLTTATATNGTTDHFVAAYADGRDGSSAIHAFASIDGGQNWTVRADATQADVRVAQSGDPAVEPHAFMRFGRAYVAYTRFNAWNGGGNVRRVFLRADDSPYETWEAERRVDGTSNDTAFDLYTPSGVVARTGTSSSTDTLAVVWNQIGGSVSTPERDVYFRFSTNSGTSWSSTLAVNANDHNAELPVIASDGQGMAYVAWRSTNDRVAFRRINLTAGTPAFETTQFLQPNPATIGSSDIKIAADAAGNVHVAWTDLRSAKKTVRVASARSCGVASNAATCTASWTQVAGVIDGIVVSTGAVTDDASVPSIAARSGNVVVAWQDTRSGASDIRVNRATFVGSAWNWLTEPQRADAGDGAGSTASLSPHVAYGQGSNVVVTWQDLRSPASAIYANVSIDGGTTFYNGAGATSLRMDAHATGAAADSSSPFVLPATTANRAGVVFLDFRTGAGANGLLGDVYTQLLQ